MPAGSAFRAVFVFAIMLRRALRFDRFYGIALARQNLSGTRRKHQSRLLRAESGIDIARLLWFVASRTGFLKAFTHVLDGYVRHEADPRELLACIIATGTNMGLRKMAEISGLGYASLVSCARNYIRVETVHSANDAISRACQIFSVLRS
jgi:hypothetical protein